MPYDETDCPYDDDECPYAEDGHYYGHGRFNTVCSGDPECCPFHTEEDDDGSFRSYGAC